MKSFFQILEQSFFLMLFVGEIFFHSLQKHRPDCQEKIANVISDISEQVTTGMIAFHKFFSSQKLSAATLSICLVFSLFPVVHAEDTVPTLYETESEVITPSQEFNGMNYGRKAELGFGNRNDISCTPALYAMTPEKRSNVNSLKMIGFIAEKTELHSVNITVAGENIESTMVERNIGGYYAYGKFESPITRTGPVQITISAKGTRDEPECFQSYSYWVFIGEIPEGWDWDDFERNPGDYINPDDLNEDNSDDDTAEDPNVNKNDEEGGNPDDSENNDDVDTTNDSEDDSGAHPNETVINPEPPVITPPITHTRKPEVPFQKCQPTFPEKRVKPIIFPDVENHENKDDILLLQELGIVQGMNDGNFYPDEQISHAELIKILSLSTGCNNSIGVSISVTSKAEGDWFSEFVKQSESKKEIQQYMKKIPFNSPHEKTSRKEIVRAVRELIEVNSEVDVRLNDFTAREEIPTRGEVVSLIVSVFNE